MFLEMKIITEVVHISNYQPHKIGNNDIYSEIRLLIIRTDFLFEVKRS